MQLYDTFTVLRLMIFESGLSFLKCLSISRRKAAPTLVVTDMLKGGLNHMMFLDLVFLFLRVSGAANSSLWLWPLSYINLVCFFSTKTMGIMKIHFRDRVGKYDP